MAIVIPTSGEPITATSRDLVNTTWYRFFSDIGRISPFMQTLLDDPDATTALATLGIATGTYLPTLFNTTNLTASTSYDIPYLRVGDRVIVSGFVDVDPNAGGGTATVLGISLPVVSNLGSGFDCLGVGGASQFAESYVIAGDAVNDRANMSWVATATVANHSVGFMFMYRVL